MFDFDEIEDDVKKQGGGAWTAGGKRDAVVKEPNGAESGRVPENPAAIAHRRPGALPLGISRKVIISGIESEKELNGKVGELMPPGYDPGTRRYMVKVMNFGSSGRVTGRAENQSDNMRAIRGENLELHPDQIEKDRLEAEDGAIVIVGGNEAERAARAMLYEQRLDPQYSYDKAIERIFNAHHEFEVLDLEPRWLKGNLKEVKRAYRKLSVAVHPDKNKHPQAVDAFRKVYGAFETLMDLKQQWRLLFVLGKLTEDEQSLYELEAEEDERFEWWWEANVPEMEKQAAEAEGGEFEDIGEKWIGGGEKLSEVKWIGLSEAIRLHSEGKAIFLDSRETFEYGLEHIAGAYTVPMKDFVDYGLEGVAGDWVKQIIRNRDFPIIIYSDVATPFSRCRSLCRWMLAAGSKSLAPERLRRLRGGIFGWRHKKAPMQLALADVSPEKRAEMRRAFPKQVGGLAPGMKDVNVRVRVKGFVESAPGEEGGVAVLHDATGGVVTWAKSESLKKPLREAASRLGSVLVYNADVQLSKEGKIRLVLHAGRARVERSDKELAIGFEAASISEARHDP